MNQISLHDEKFYSYVLSEERNKSYNDKKTIDLKEIESLKLFKW